VARGVSPSPPLRVIGSLMAHDQIATRQIRRVAREALGFDRLRPGQQEIIQSAVDGHDTLAVMPTGYGKSAIYQIAGALLPGATLVVSPLIALQQDQLASLSEGDAGEAVAVNSTLGEGEREEAFEELEAEKIEFIFMAPEQFNNEEVLERLRESKVSLFVVDEAHCISEWGHDFRPDYLRLSTVIEALGHPVVLALTATASPPVRREIVERLGMRDPRVMVHGFDRPNIWLGVETFGDETAKQAALLERVAEADKPGIVYTATRKHAEEIAGLLERQGLRAANYHAGMGDKARQRVQDAFMGDELDVIVATIAFGMGVDKPNVRFVFHYEISASVDAYYQEIGRAGRDGQPARAILFYAPKDLGLRRFFASAGQLEVDDVRALAEAVQAGDEPVRPAELAENSDLSKTKIETALNRLAETGAVEKLSTGEVAPADEPVDLEGAAEAAAAAQARRRQYEQSRLDMMRGYAEVPDCRRRYLLSYFGEALLEACGNCDRCDAGLSTVITTAAEQPFPVGSRVLHAQWGVGQVIRYEGETVAVLFDEVGYKTLAVAIVTENGLLRAA
jgi:ATP-dependent DNA helicase RecQ